MLTALDNPIETYQTQLDFLHNFEISLIEAQQKLNVVSPAIQARNQLLQAIEVDMLPGIRALQTSIQEKKSPLTHPKMDELKSTCAKQQKNIASLLEHFLKDSANYQAQAAPTLLLLKEAKFAQSSVQTPTERNTDDRKTYELGSRF